MISEKHFDFIVAGSGASGLSLALVLSRSALKDSSILLIDRDQKTKNDHTWCFWADQLPVEEQVIFKKWKKIDFIGKAKRKRFDLHAYSYYMVRAIDYYNYVKSELRKKPNIKTLIGSIENIVDGDQGATVTVDGITFDCNYCFDSRFDFTNFNQDTRKYHYLKQHFLGWEIETPTPTFDTSSAILFDFRTEQQNEMRFFYTLPINDKRALIEYTLFSEKLLEKEEYIQAIERYLKVTLGIPVYYLHNEESGVIPMTDHKFQRKTGNHIMAIGSAGGLVKPSTGYAFLRILKDSNAIVKSLELNGHPFELPNTAHRYKIFDRVMLHVIQHHGSRCHSIFSDLFIKNNIQRIFGFLDETDNVFSNMKLMATLPLFLFLKSYVQTIIFKKT